MEKNIVFVFVSVVWKQFARTILYVWELQMFSDDQEVLQILLTLCPQSSYIYMHGTQNTSGSLSFDTV